MEKLIGLKQEEIDGKSNIYATTWVFLALVILLSGLEAATFYLFNYKVEKLFSRFCTSIYLFYEIFQFHPWNKLIFGDPNNVLGLENEKNGQVREEENKEMEGSKGMNRCCCCSVETGTAILR